MLYKAHTLILLCIVVNKALVSAEDIPATDDIEPKVITRKLLKYCFIFIFLRFALVQLVLATAALIFLPQA